MKLLVVVFSWLLVSAVCFGAASDLPLSDEWQEYVGRVQEALIKSEGNLDVALKVPVPVNPLSLEVIQHLGGGHGHGHHHHHHHHGDAEISGEQMAELYVSLLNSINRLGATSSMTNRPYFYSAKYPGEKVFVNDSAFADALYASMKILREMSLHQCQHCHHDHEEDTSSRKPSVAGAYRDSQVDQWVKQVAQWARTTGIEISGEAFEKLKSDGLGFATWFFLFESWEHFILDPVFPVLYAVPFCPLGLALYAATIGSVKRTYALASNPMGNSHMLRRYWNALTLRSYKRRFYASLKSVHAEVSEKNWDQSEYRMHLKIIGGKLAEVEKRFSKTSFWTEVGSAAQPLLLFAREDFRSRPTTALVEDLRRVISEPDRETRVFKMIQHVEGLRLLNELLSETIHEQFADDGVSGLTYFKIKGAVGDIGKLVTRYEQSLASMAMSTNLRRGPEKLQHMETMLANIVSSFSRATPLVVGNLDGLVDLKADVDKAIFHHEVFKDQIREGVVADCVRSLYSLSESFFTKRTSGIRFTGK